MYCVDRQSLLINSVVEKKVETSQFGALKTFLAIMLEDL